MQPRKFSFSGNTFALVFGGFWLAIGLIFLPIGLSLAWHEYQRSRSVPAEGAFAVGTVLTKAIASSSKDSDPYSIEFRFTTRDGKQIKGRAKITHDEWNLLTERGTVKVGYLPDNPQINRVPGQIGDTISALVFSLMGSVFSLLGGVIFGVAFVRMRRSGRIRKIGQSAQALVESVNETNFSVNNVRQVAVRYSYKDQSGREYHGKSEPMAPEQGELWKPGDRGAVRFDGDAPQNSVWIGKEGE